jgi:hypothetical protein
MNMIKLHSLGGSWEKCVGGGGLEADVRTHRGRIVAKSTRAYKEGGGVSFCHVFAYVLNGRPQSNVVRKPDPDFLLAFC